jgi:hypothetical protein
MQRRCGWLLVVQLTWLATTLNSTAAIGHNPPCSWSSDGQ